MRKLRIQSDDVVLVLFFYAVADHSGRQYYAKDRVKSYYSTTRSDITFRHDSHGIER